MFDAEHEAGALFECVRVFHDAKAKGAFAAAALAEDEGDLAFCVEGVSDGGEDF